MSNTPDIAGRKARILVVDDERDNRELVDIILSWEGFSIVTASGGEEALETAALGHLDLILMDVMMPGMDGFQATAKLKGSLATKGIPIIIVTAMTDSHALDLARTAGAEDFLAKPVDRDELVLRVRNLLRKTYTDYHDN